MQQLVTFKEREEFIPVDEWVPKEEEIIFQHTKGAIILPVAKFYNTTNPNLDYFMTAPKRSYNSPEMRDHCTHYLNYFERFYDQDRELLMVYFKIKFLMDLEPAYDEQAFLYDIKRYILSPGILYKFTLMNRDNYNLSLRYEREENLRYTNKHGFILMNISLIMNALIPLMTHFISVKKVAVNPFLLKVYDEVLDLFDVDIFSKLYETSNTNITKNTNHNPIWGKQDIRGVNTTTLSIKSVENILINIMPKYQYQQNMVCFNFRSIVKTIKYQVTDIAYEYDFISLSSSKRDEENNSEFDKFESYLTKQDESLYLQNKVNCQETMKFIENCFGPFDKNEINYYMKTLSDGDNIIINGFQQDLIFNLFYKYFGDVTSIKAINKEDYVKLIIAARKTLQSNNMVILPYIISSKVTRLTTRKNINKKELIKLQASPFYKVIQEKYKNEKILTQILSLIATILASEFVTIDFYDKELDGKPLNSLPADIISEEILMYICLI